MNIYEHAPKSFEHLILQDSLLKKKKKKCHGNRKLQRYRRRCQAKGMNDRAIELLMLIKKANKSVHQNTQETHEDQKNGLFIINVVSNVMNMSTLLENQHLTNEYQGNDANLELHSTNELFISSQTESNEELSSPPATTFRTRIKHYNLSNDHWKQVSKVIPNYKKLSTYQFKDALMKVIPASSQHHIKEYYIHMAMLQFIQERTEIICHILQLKIEQDYWNYIDDLTSLPMLNICF
ncbi:unnamed protein product [Rotaria sp. Silwood2]|nr:unnamed protein product [Rotaria sp. Silwood2]